MSARLDQDRGPGPRGTPTARRRPPVRPEREWRTGLSCAKDGSKSLAAEYPAGLQRRRIRTGCSASRRSSTAEHLIVTPGGDQRRHRGARQNDREDGLDQQGAERSRRPIRPASSPMCRACAPSSVSPRSAGVGVRASDGKLMWRYTKVANRTANIATPDRLRQQSVLHLRLRHRRRRCCRSKPERRGEGGRDLLHAAT